MVGPPAGTAAACHSEALLEKTIFTSLARLAARDHPFWKVSLRQLETLSSFRFFDASLRIFFGDTQGSIAQHST